MVCATGSGRIDVDLGHVIERELEDRIAGAESRAARECGRIHVDRHGSGAAPVGAYTCRKIDDLGGRVVLIGVALGIQLDGHRSR